MLIYVDIYFAWSMFKSIFWASSNAGVHNALQRGRPSNNVGLQHGRPPLNARAESGRPPYNARVQRRRPPSNANAQYSAR